jgi:very-short-patch-repair endonuclease
MPESVEDCREQVLASAIRFLIDGNQREAASTLFSCSLETMDEETIWIDEGYGNAGGVKGIYLKLRCPRYAYDHLTSTLDGDTQKYEGTTKCAVESAFSALFKPKPIELDICAELIEINSNWREEILEYIKGYKMNNQGAFLKEDKAIYWSGFRFASPSEVEIAKALDKRKLLFLPNSKARLYTRVGGEINIYPDFLICSRKKWGILEIDSGYHYNSSKAAADRLRDERFAFYGVPTKRFDYEECLQDPDGVIGRFLEFLHSLLGQEV